MAHPNPLLFLLSTLLSSLSSAATNLLLTGEILPSNTHLSTQTATFILHHNCNLALYNPTLLFQSHTHTHTHTQNCTLTLTHRGQLLIQTPNGSTIWSSSPPSVPGRYAALLRNDGHVAVYGPSIWSTPTPTPTPMPTPTTTPRWNGAVAKHVTGARNHMFSTQVLYGESKLGGGEHVLVMKEDCGLELVRGSEEVVWESGTKGGGRSCFVRLDQRGQLAVVDDRFRVVWASEGADGDGFYVLVVQDDGRVAVYGPAIWSTAAT